MYSLQTQYYTNKVLNKYFKQDSALETAWNGIFIYSYRDFVFLISAPWKPLSSKLKSGQQLSPWE